MTLLVSGAAVTGCGDERPPKPDLSENQLEPQPRRPDSGGVCYHEGCACENEGTTRDCGVVKEQVAGYLWCSMGVQQCSDGVWSECKGDRIVLGPQVRNLRLQGLGASRECGDDNPCSPGCHLFEDDAGGLPLPPDAGLVDADGGLALGESPNVPGGLCTSIAVSPETSELRITELEPFDPPQTTFVAELLPAGCGGDDVPIVYSVDKTDVAEISETGELTLRAPVVGPIEVRALAGSLAGTATLNVTVRIEDTALAPPGMADEFEGEPESDDVLAQWLYPYAGTVFPPNVHAPLLQWDSVVSAEASWNGGCGLRADGTVRCWGPNYNGEIVDRDGPYVKLSGRYTHFCALTPQGDAECWGDNSNGQATNQAGPFISVHAGAQHSCGLRPDGEVRCWGHNNWGQAAPPNAGPFVALSTGAYTTCGVTAAKDVLCWGNGSSGQTDPPWGPSLAVAAGTDHVCALRTDRSLVCWGSNARGQTESPAGAFVSLDAGSYHTCALRTDGASVCWGQNTRGQSQTVEGPFVSVTAAGEHSCAVRVDGGVQCWGNMNNDRGQGLPGGAVRVGIRYPASGDSTFEWSSTVPESRGEFVDAPANTIPLAPAPRLRIPQLVWDTLAASARGEEVAFTLQRHTGDRLLAPVERVVRFSDSPLRGKIVYQSYGTRRVENATGTYEDPYERWGAVIFEYDARARENTVAVGSASENGSGCRGCHSASADGQFLLAGLDERGVAALSDRSNSEEEAVPTLTDEWGGGVWSAVHPSLPLAFTSRGPTPCATRIDENWGSCDAASFTSAAGDLSGAGHVIQAPPGGMLGAGWLDSDGDGVYDVAAPNTLVDLARDTLGQRLEATIPAQLRAVMPAFSPEGDRVVFLHYAGELEDGLGTLHTGDRRSLGMMDFDAATLRLQNFQRLTNEPEAPCDARFGATEACVDVWPSFLPRGTGVVFQRQVVGNGSIPGSTHSDLGGTRSACESKNSETCDDGAKGDLWWVRLDSDGQPVATQRLERASGVVESAHLVTTGAGGVGVIRSRDVEPLLNYQPAAAPEAFGGHTWVAFTSRRRYGNVAKDNPWWSDPMVQPLRHVVNSKKIWISALEVNSDEADPSAPAFYLEGQEVQGSNGRPIWIGEECIASAEPPTEAAECGSDADCCGAPEMARCQVDLPLTDPPRRHCVAVNAQQCIAPDDHRLCTGDEECCGFERGERCASGRCVEPPPLARYQPATFVRDFHAECPEGTLPRWKFLEWKAQLPEGTSITFTAASAPTRAELDDAGEVDLHTAVPPAPATWTTWGTDDADSIDAKLAEGGYLTHEWLRVGMTLNPDDGLVLTPTLSQWRLVYDCVDGF